MKKQQYVAAVACLVAGAIGFASVYATEKVQQKRDLARIESEKQEGEELSAASNELKPKQTEPVQQAPKESRKVQPEVPVEEETPKADIEDVQKKEPAVEEPTVTAAVVETLHFEPERGVVWPIEGVVLLDYSMDSTIYFPTLEQYRCNPAMVVSAAVNDKVCAVMRGKIIEVYNSEETGCTVRQDLGDGYIATYGQLKEPVFKVGDMVESGQVIGYVSEPTKYYSVEGANVYFSLSKDGAAVDPKEYLPMQDIDTLE